MIFFSPNPACCDISLSPFFFWVTFLKKTMKFAGRHVTLPKPLATSGVEDLFSTFSVPVHPSLPPAHCSCNQRWSPPKMCWKFAVVQVLQWSSPLVLLSDTVSSSSNTVLSCCCTLLLPFRSYPGRFKRSAVHNRVSGLRETFVLAMLPVKSPIFTCWHVKRLSQDASALKKKCDESGN